VIYVVTTEKPVQASLYQVKKAEKEREGFKKKTSWLLRQLKLFDAKYINKVNKVLHMSGTVLFLSENIFVYLTMWCCMWRILK